MLIKMFTFNISAHANEFSQQLEQTADIAVKRLEDEAMQLELLLEEAEAKMAMLNRQVEEANKTIQQLNGLGRKQVPAAIEQNQIIPAAGINGITGTAEQPETVSAFAKTVTADSKPMPPEPVNHERHRIIMAMADQGYNVTEIAKATGSGKGEIMLLLQLHKK
ncbi:DUF6115 domain-containing protein [Sporomusa termitida]|nr:hypothetical protein [Sporomusa termitida]